MTREELRDRLRAAAGHGVRVAVVDSGWEGGIVDPRVAPVVEPGSPSHRTGGDENGHGTACALRVLQVAPAASIVPVRVFQRVLETSVSRLCEGIVAARDCGVQIINLSLATHRSDAIRPLYRVCEETRRMGIVIVASAHNRGGRAVPAYLEPVLSVESGPQTEFLDFTYEPEAAIECTAAAHGVPTTGPDGQAVRRSGTSIAAATLSGIVARLLEIEPGGLDHVRRLLALTSSSNPGDLAAARDMGGAP